MLQTYFLGTFLCQLEGNKKSSRLIHWEIRQMKPLSASCKF